MTAKSQKFALYDAPQQIEPLLPGEHRQRDLLELAHDLQREALALPAQLEALPELRSLLRAMNSYYSNKIEGQHTLPSEIEQALKKDYAHDADKARRQRLALAHIATEENLDAHAPGWDAAYIWSPQLVRDLHQDLFARLPESDLALDEGGRLQPGAWRDRDVSVGRHVAPAHGSVPALLQRWGAFYFAVRRGELQLLAIAASHHRLAWIHPFRDGNGRVARLHTHLLLRHGGLSRGLWSPLRGFAREHAAYYAALDAADAPRAGDLDGRCNLSEAGLIAWMRFVLETCLDQVRFMSPLLAARDMPERIAACLAYEESVVQRGVRRESLRALHYLFATQTELERGEFKALLGLGDRLATAQVAALLARGLLQSDSPHGRVRFGVPQHALRFYFPRLWPEAEADHAR